MTKSIKVTVRARTVSDSQIERLYYAQTECTDIAEDCRLATMTLIRPETQRAARQRCADAYNALQVKP